MSEAAHFRVQLTGAQAVVAVFKGKVSATSPSGQVDVAEKHSATIDLGDPAKKDAVVIAKNYDAEPTDEWDRQQADYHDRYVSAGDTNFSSPYTYGVSDLNYYGSFMNCPGYGLGWQPFFTDASWSPFQDGGWMWYPGSGYMFVSSYPWGWMPYRYGSWAFASGCGGWMWQPGSWNNWYTLSPVVNPPKRFSAPKPPVLGRQTVLLGRGLTANPAPGAPRRLTINPGSAGLGVPRGSVHHLDRVAKTMEQTSRPVAVWTARPASAPATGFGTASTSSSSPARAGTFTGTTTSSRPRSAPSPHH